MIAKQLISAELIPLKTSDTGKEALTFMSDYYVSQMPIVNNKQLLGLIAEEDILEHDVEEAVGSYELSLSQVFVHESDHIFDVLNRVAEYRLTVVPVIDNEENYIGLITARDLLYFFANSFSFDEPGSIIVLEVPRSDYLLSTIARIVESEDAAVLCSFITSHTDTSSVYVNLKINRSQIQHIVASFERHKYKVYASYTEDDYNDILKQRYDELIHYLTM